MKIVMALELLVSVWFVLQQDSGNRLEANSAAKWLEEPPRILP